jgi:hypothetical protein
MDLARSATTCCLVAITSALAVRMLAGSAAPDQTDAETFTATATVKSATGGTAQAPITIVVDRKMSQAEADTLTGAFKTGGPAALRKKLEGVPVTGSVRFGAGRSTATRMTLERATDTGRLLTIVTDEPLLFLGGGLPNATAKEGYDFGIIDIEVDESGSGSGTMMPAAKVSVKQDVFVVVDYSSERIQLTDVKKVK